MKYFYLVLALILSSCVPQTRTNQLVPVVRSSTQTGKPVAVNTKLGSYQSRVEGLEVTNDNFKEALEKSLVDSGLFRQIGSGGYQLDAAIVTMNQPAAVFGVTTRIEVDYTLRRDGAAVWSKIVRSTHTTETSESLVAEIRDRNSAEGAMRENIKIAISSMSEALK